MAWFAAALPFIKAAGTVATIVGTVQKGKADERAAKAQAQQLEQRAGQERASSQRQAREERRQANLAQSRAQAVAAASGAGATDKTTLDIMGGLEEEGEFRALSALFEGEERARGSEFGGEVERFRGKNARRSANTRAVSTLLNDSASLFERYGPKPSA